MHYKINIAFKKNEFIKNNTTINDVAKLFPIQEKRKAIVITETHVWLTYLNLNSIEFEEVLDYIKLTPYQQLIEYLKIQFQ